MTLGNHLSPNIENTPAKNSKILIPGNNTASYNSSADNAITKSNSCTRENECIADDNIPAATGKVADNLGSNTYELTSFLNSKISGV